MWDGWQFSNLFVAKGTACHWFEDYKNMIEIYDVVTVYQ